MGHRHLRSPGPFERHLRDAIALNRERAPVYAALSNGASRRISRVLIAAEWMLLPMARWFDRRAAPYERASVPLLESLFLPMSTAASLVDHPVSVRELAGQMVRPSKIRQRVRRAFAEGGFPAAEVVLAKELDALRAQPETDCLLRHLLESTHRLAHLAPVHDAAARARGLPSPAPMLARLLRLHLLGFRSAALLDLWARPLQARGIPILARDLPPITAESTY